MFRFLVFIASLVAAAHAFGHGAPDAVCENLTPDHGEDPQPGPAPYKISINKNEIHPGDEVEVTLEGLNGEEFKGFILQARVKSNIVGFFDLDPNNSKVQTLDCPKGKKNAVTHRNADKKSKVTVNWVAPKDLHDTVVFTGSIVKEGPIYWVAETSAGLTVRP